jgi:hypothetical protein
MARRSLKPQLNQIRAWVRQGRTDAWIAHQLEVSASELREFRKQHDLTPDGEEAGGEVDLRDEIEAEIEAATAEEEAEEELQEEAGKAEAEAEEGEGEDDDEGEEAEEEKPARPTRPARERKSSGERKGEERPDEGKEGDEKPGEARPRRRRRRGRRGGRGRRREIEATFDHGERDGYGLWLDASVKDNPVYAEHWAGKREVTVRIDPDQIVIRRAGESPSGDSDE